MDHVERLKLYQDNKVPARYRFPYYVDLASQDKFLGREVAHALGIETYVSLQDATHERSRALDSSGQCMEMKQIVASAFGFSAEEINMN
ncbi:hypothetical protein AN958_05686 [Leucoagaricus sp. SymC.cos]|nr:hypothetical protein AN958_05686 [Leucoagaricus sp. SymC.cos]